MGGRSGRRPRVARECHLAVRPSPKAVSGSRDRGCNGHRILWRVPNDRRHPSSKRASALHGDGAHDELGGSHILRSSLTRKNAGGWRRQRNRQRRGSSTKRWGCNWGVATGVSEARPHECRGKKTPTFETPAREGLELEASTQRRSAEAVSGVVKHSVPQSCRPEPYSPGDVHAGQPAERVGNARGAGARSSYGWQKSVRRIARLLHRSVARSDGG